MKNSTPKTDKQIVKLSLKDDKYFVQLVEKYEKPLGRYILRISNVDTQTAEDILQEAFIKVYKNLNDFDEKFSFSSWIYRITHNEVINFIRKMKRSPQTVNIEKEDMDNDFINIINLIPDETNIQEEASKKELAKKIRKIVNSLPQQYKDVLVLRFMEDKSYKEISDILKKSINSVSVSISRAKEQLKKQLKKTNQ